MINNQTEESYILREYYKGFIPNKIELLKIKEIINKTDRQSILNNIINQDQEIYKLISENYKNTFEILNLITEKIDSIKKLENENNNTKNNDFQEYYFVNLLDNKEEINILNNEKEHYSIKTINEFIKINKNKIIELNNEIETKQNLIKKKEIELKNLILTVDELKKDSYLLIDNLNEKYIVNLEENDNNIYLITIFLSSFLNLNLENLNGNKMKIISLYNMKDKKSMKNELKNIENINNNINKQEYLNKIKKQINLVKDEFNDENMNNQNYEYFYNLFKIMKCILNIYSYNNEIQNYKYIIQYNNDFIIQIQNNIKQIQEKIDIYNKTKINIINKYKYEKKDLNNNNLYDKKEFNNQEKKQQNNFQFEINQLKSLIFKMENNYISLLKGLSKKIIKPKNLIKKQDDQFYLNKIK